MPHDTGPERTSRTTMQKRLTTLPDGRYLIFYSFDEQAATSTPVEAKMARPEPQPEPVAEDERVV
jgi:hypothetical protein